MILREDYFWPQTYGINVIFRNIISGSHKLVSKSHSISLRQRYENKTFLSVSSTEPNFKNSLGTATCVSHNLKIYSHKHWIMGGTPWNQRPGNPTTQPLYNIPPTPQQHFTTHQTTHPTTHQTPPTPQQHFTVQNTTPKTALHNKPPRPTPYPP